MAIVESPAEAAAPGAPSRSVGDYINDYFRRLAGGELGALPAVAGLVVLCVIFTVLRPVFFSALNFANLFTQGAQVVVIAMGLVFVLLLGEIDHSAGFTSGVCAAVLATLLTNEHWPWYLAVLVAVITRVGDRAALGALIAIRVGAVALIGGLAVYFLNIERSQNPLRVSLRGVSMVVPLILVLLLIWTFVLSRTAYGRHIYAVGGNAEASRRAGINVDRIKVSVFVICSSMAAVGGIVAASRANSVDPNTGGGNILLYSVGAAVIGRTRLVGGERPGPH